MNAMNVLDTRLRMRAKASQSHAHLDGVAATMETVDALIVDFSAMRAEYEDCMEDGTDWTVGECRRVETWLKSEADPADALKNIVEEIDSLRDLLGTHERMITYLPCLD